MLSQTISTINSSSHYNCKIASDQCNMPLQSLEIDLSSLATLSSFGVLPCTCIFSREHKWSPNSHAEEGKNNRDGELQSLQSCARNRWNRTLHQKYKRIKTSWTCKYTTHQTAQRWRAPRAVPWEARKPLAFGTRHSPMHHKRVAKDQFYLWRPVSCYKEVGSPICQKQWGPNSKEQESM